MKQTIIKLVTVLVVMTALVMLVGDLPDTSLGLVAIIKAAGLGLLILAARIWNKYIPNEEEV